MKRRPCWCSKPTEKLSFVPINLHSCLTREWKRSRPESSCADTKIIPDRVRTVPERGLEPTVTEVNTDNNKYWSKVSIGVSSPNHYQPLRYDVRCTWMTCSSSVPLSFVLYPDRFSCRDKKLSGQCRHSISQRRFCFTCHQCPRCWSSFVSPPRAGSRPGSAWHSPTPLW